MAKFAQSPTTESSKKLADSGLPSGAISRAQLKEPVSLPLPHSNGALASSHGSHIAEKARTPQSGDAGNGAKRAPPSSWDESLTTFLSRFCSRHQFGLESMAVWHDDMAKLATPSGQTRQVLANSMPQRMREQWCEAEGYIKHLAQQLAVDFLSEVDPALRNLQFILRILLKGLCLTLDSERMTKVIADRPIAPGAIDLIADKCSAMESGEVRAYAFRQTLSDSTPLYRQTLHYILLAISRLDIRGSQSAYAFYQDLLAMLLDISVPQPSHGLDISARANIFVSELVETIGPANTFNVDCSQADKLVRSLLVNAVDAPSAPSAQGLVLSAYSYLFSRQSASTQSKLTEQHSLLLLLLLIAQPVGAAKSQCSPYLHALASIRDASDGGASKLDSFGALASVPFPKLFTKLMAETLSAEWTVLFQVLVLRNEAFRTYVLSRTDTDTLVLPLLRRINLATALPIPSSAAQTAQASQAPVAQHGHKRNGGGGGSVSIPGRRPGDRFVSSASARTKPAEHGSSYVTLVTEPAALGGDLPAYPRSTPLAQAPAPKHSAGAAATATASSAPTAGSSPRSKVRQAALLPYAITADNIPYVHLYLWLDILLSLSCDAQFVELLGRTTVESWPSLPHPMYKQPLSHCIVVEAMRVFQLNIMLLKDSQIHRLSLGILVNILNQTTNVTTAIGQKLVKLFDMILKRHTKLESLAGSDVEELDVYTEVLTVLLALFCRLINTNNPQFIYCLLQAREILGAFQENSARPELETASGRRAVAVAAEVRVRIAYFHARIAALPSGSQAREILQLIASVVAGEGGRSQRRVDFSNSPRLDDDDDCRRWSDFMLPMAWELLLSSSISTVDDISTPLIEEFERLVL
ncbi:hypothetical protein IW152_003923 [Coemansia sp. BCRC 34962]|nr:hypothetical protein IW152_003923 [Coemansia sp. BCRC 34962]